VEAIDPHEVYLEFYDRFYEPGAYLETHAGYIARWHLEAMIGKATGNED